jgi:acetyl-CoA carboxylase biotin carboxyl carrier protein
VAEASAADGAPPAGGAPSEPSGDPTQADAERLLALLPALVRELAAGGVTELEVSSGGASLYLRQRPGAPGEFLEEAPAEGGAEGGIEEGLVVVAAPLAGVFYPAPAPEEPPYVTAGDTVEPGQVVALVEAMKVFNEIHADVAGTVEAVLVASGQSVKAGQPLITLRPDPAALTPDSAT